MGFWNDTSNTIHEMSLGQVNVCAFETSGCGNGGAMQSRSFEDTGSIHAGIVVSTQR